jgi:hypothetical protein
MIKKTFYFFIYLILFFLITVPSIIYSISSWFLIPLGWLSQLIIGKPIFNYKAGIVALKSSTVILLSVIPIVIYIYINEIAGLLFFIWMALYLLIRVYSGVHEKEKNVIDAWRQLDILVGKYSQTFIKYNPIATIATILLNLISLMIGYYIGGNVGLVIGSLIAIILWCLSPYVKVIRDK